MIIGLDYWNVCSSNPYYFGTLARRALEAGDEVHIISAIGKGRAGSIAGEVDALGIPYTSVTEVVFSHPRESPRLKVECARSLGVTVFYDDRDDVCREMTDAGILALRVTRPDKRSDVKAERRH